MINISMGYVGTYKIEWIQLDNGRWQMMHYPIKWKWANDRR